MLRPRSLARRRLLTASTLRSLSWLGVLAIAGYILFATLGPGSGGAGQLALGRCAFGIPCVVGHFGIFALLGVALAGLFATSRSARQSPRRALAMLLLAIWIFAALTEMAQRYIDREPSLADWSADMAGAVTGLLVGGVLLRLLLGGQLVEAVPPPEARRSMVAASRERGPGGGRPRRKRRR